MISDKQIALNEYILKQGLLPLGTKIRVMHPKSRRFYEEGVIVEHLSKSVIFVFDYKIEFKDGFDHFDDSLVKEI